MDKDPWADIFAKSSDTQAEPITENEDLTLLNQMRKQMGEEYSTEKGKDPSTYELGEMYGDDTEFETVLRDSVQEGLGHEPAILYNPGSGEHLAMAHAFPAARTILVDDDGDIEHAFVQHNTNHPDTPYEFYRADMHIFELPDNLKADATLVLNAGYMTQEELDRVVSEQGIVIVNNWHGAASYMQENCDEYTLIKKIDQGDEANDLYLFRRIN